MPRQTTRRQVLKKGSIATVGVAGVAGCSQSGGNTTTTGGGGATEAVVGSKTYTEQILLGYFAHELLNAKTDMNVVDETEYGGNPEMASAYQEGNVHAYYEYMGSMWSAHPPQHTDPVTESPDAQYQQLKSEMESEHPIQILDRTDWQNTWAPYARPAALEGTDISTLSDLASYVNSGNYDLTIVLEVDFAEAGRGDGWAGLTEHYGFEDEHLTAWDENDGILTVDVGRTYDAVNSGRADIGIGYSTSAQLSTFENTLLDDDENYWPFYHLVGVIHEDVATDAATSAMNQMPATIEDASTMQELNARVDIDGEDPQQVANDFLSSNGVI